MFRNIPFIALFAVLSFFLTRIQAQQDSTCSAVKQCESGCCSSEGNCGFGPEFCGDGCQGTCDAKAECGEFADKDKFACPLDVCCSEWGFCGTTEGFCNENCQNKGGCKPVSRPDGCEATDDAMQSDVRIAYYGAWGASRDCDSIQPENIPAGVLTHIFVAFEFVSEDFEITDEVGDIAARTSRLKRAYPGLRVHIAIGGWTFNDPPTQHRFSDMASTVENREKFVNSLLKYIDKYALDGVDIDWEYPVADDRGGVDEDYDNFVQLMSDIRDAFDSEDPGLQSTLTLPSSYWYLRGFNIKELEKYVDWFNVMTYDVHGMWDKNIESQGPYLKGHTNITEIGDGLDLLWRNDISSDKVVMGYGFYGRGFVMEDTSCYKPPGCKFKGPSLPGSCTNEAGILSYSEITSRHNELGTDVFYDEESTVKYMVFGSNQWISYDDEESFAAKKKFQSSLCLKGMMLWSLDLDDPSFGAMHALFGGENMADALGEIDLTGEEKEKLVDELAQYTGQNCYVAIGCASSSDDDSKNAQCGSGYKAVEMAHAPYKLTASQKGDLEKCDRGEYHYVCCPEKEMPQNCEWIGAPEQSEFGCSRTCGDSQFMLASDSYVDYKGEGSCYSGRRSLCCDTIDLMGDCWWTDCGATGGNRCGDDGENVAVYRVDDDDGHQCDTGSDYMAMRQLCCPKNKPGLKNCEWADDFQKRGYGDKSLSFQRWYACNQKDCPADKLEYDSSSFPSIILDYLSRNPEDDGPRFGPYDCGGLYPSSNNVEPEFPLCCNPPSPFDRELPVDPAFLWSDAHDKDDSDNTWQFSDNFGNNDKDKDPDDMNAEPGEDPYGFIMLNGPEGSLNDKFASDFTVVQQEEPRDVQKRSLVTSNQTILDQVFENSQETMYVYCNHPHDSRQCRRTFYKGAKDTIIRLPHHVGDGPFARIVSMERVENPVLPAWIHRKRTLGGHTTGVYKVDYDYDFASIQADEGDEVNMRVDFTNLQEYWDDVTDEKPDKRRSTEHRARQMPFEAWRERVDKAKKRDLEKHAHIEKRRSRRSFNPDEDSDVKDLNEKGISTRTMERRWWGSFKAWLKKLNTIVQDEQGVLPMGYDNTMTLYSGRLECENGGVTITAGLDVIADFDFDMRTQYAYYFSGTIVPPNIIDTYAYVGSHPRMEAGITVAGEAHLEYTSGRKKIIDTLTYPGLAIKGVAAVGPSLDIWGQIKGEITVAGEMRVGVEYTFEPIELYMPNDDETLNKAKENLEDRETEQTGLRPTFDASVRADVGFGVLVTPEVNLGIKVGGGFGKFKKTILDAHVSAFVNTTLWFYANAKAELSKGWEYSYGVRFYYRVGFAAIVDVILLGGWSTGLYYPWDEQLIDLYGPVKVTSSDDDGDRMSSLSGSGTRSKYIAEKAHSYPLFGPSSSGLGSVKPDNTTGDLMIRADDPNDNGQFKWGDFTCVTRDGTGACTFAELPDDDAMSSMAANSSSSKDISILTKGKSECRDKLPVLYYNCLTTFFAPFTYIVSGKTANFPGICQSVQKFLNGRKSQAGDRGSSSNKWILNWDSEKERTKIRRRQSCKSYCTKDNVNLGNKLFGSGKAGAGLTSCDEFPFAGSEEGGKSFYGIHDSVKNPSGTARTCVPSFQNDLQGQCNKILSGIQTDVNYFNNLSDVNPTGSTSQWKRWDTGEAGWTQSDWDIDSDGKKAQRLTQYSTDSPQAQAGGVSNQDYANNLGWYHKRNFTLQLVYPSVSGGTSGVQYPNQNPSKFRGTLLETNGDSPAKSTLAGADNIICGVNTLGQERYEIKKNQDGGFFNGKCWDGSTIGSVSIGDHSVSVMRAYSCLIHFNAKTKRDVPIGYFGGEPIYGVEKIEGTEEEYELPVSFDENLDSSDAENDIDLREVPRGSEFDNDSDSGEVESGLELTDELDDFVAFNPSSWSDEE